MSERRLELETLRRDLLPNPEIIAILEEFKALTRASSSPSRNLADLSLSSSFFEVTDRLSSDLIDEIDELVRLAEEAIYKDKDFFFSIPSRSKSNLIFIHELGRIVLGDKCEKRSFSDASTSRKALMTLQVLSLAREALNTDIPIMKSDIYSSDRELFGDQRETDNIIGDVSYMLRCTQSSLNIIDPIKGYVIGELTFMYDGDLIDCCNVGRTGKAIPPIIARLSDFKSNALFILVVQKTSVYMQLVEYQFHRKFRCIIIAAKGKPDMGTRQFLSRLDMDLKLPVLALVNWDPNGLEILSLYKYGSYDCLNVTTPNIKWLGVRHSHLQGCGILEENMEDMVDSDITTACKLLNDDYVKMNKAWVSELELMLALKKKADTRVLGYRGFGFLLDVFLPSKLMNQDWI